MFPITISGVVEGIVDEAVIRLLIAYIGAETGSIYGHKGKAHLLQRLSGFNNAARGLHSYWIMLIDLDRDDDCVVTYRQKCLTNITLAPGLCFRIAVREVEAWLLADREHLANFLSVPLSHIPFDPETLEYPKKTMVEIAKKSRRREIREDMVPPKGSHATEGNAYASRLIEFVTNTEHQWRPEIAAESSSSLQRAIECLQRLVIQADQAE